jgi:hypothetical protein
MEKLFPAINTMDDLRRLAKNAGIGGLIFAGMILLSAAILFFTTDTLPGFEDYMDPAERTSTLITLGVEAVVILLFTWRIWVGKGYVSGILLLILFLIEIAFKIANSPRTFLWIIMYAAIALAFVNGIRAALAYKRVSTASVSLNAF